MLDNSEKEVLETTGQTARKDCSICLKQRCCKGKDGYPDVFIILIF